MQKRELKKLRTLEKQIKELEEKRASLRDAILSDMEKQGMDKAETDFGTFSVATRYKWQYSDKVDALKEKVKLQEVREQNDGTAEAEETKYLRFTPVKE